MEFDPGKKAPMANLMVEYTKRMEGEDDQASNGIRQMTRMMQNKQTIRKLQGICPEELLYTSDEFHVKARDMNMDMDARQMWKCWPKCLENSTRKIWDEILRV